MMILLLAAAVLTVGSFIMTRLARWVSTKGPIPRNALAFCLAGGAAYSVSVVLGFWMQGSIERIPAENLMWPTVTWFIVAIICASSAVRTRGSPYAFGIPFFLFALILALSPWLPTFPATASRAWFLATAAVLCVLGALPVSRGARFVAIGVAYLYFVSVAFAVPYFNWRYARENSVVSWLCLGEIIATGKAAVWPYFAFASSHSSTEMQAQDDPDARDYTYIINSRDDLVEALKIINRFKSVSSVPRTEALEASALLDSAANEAELVPDSYLAKQDIPGFARPYKEDYIPALRGLAHGLETGDEAKSTVAMAKLKNFGDWISSHSTGVSQSASAN